MKTLNNNKMTLIIKKMSRDKTHNKNKMWLQEILVKKRLNTRLATTVANRVAFNN